MPLCAEEGRALIGETEKRELPFIALGMEEGLGDAPAFAIDNRDGSGGAARHLANSSIGVTVIGFEDVT